MNQSRIRLWLCFSVFLAANLVLSYFHFSYSLKCWVFLAGILAPFFYMVRSKFSASRPEKGFFPEALDWGMPDKWIYLLLTFLAVFFRFFRLTKFHFWPTGDEGLNGFLAIDWLLNPRWQFFYMVGELPPLLTWCLGFFFKFFRSPFFDLWFSPAVFSLLAFFAGWWALERFGSRFLCLMFSILWAVSFWPLDFGRFCHQGALVPFWELITLGLMEMVWRKAPRPQSGYRPFILGLWVGLGSFTFASWPIVVFGVTFFEGWHYLRDRRSYSTLFWPYSFGLFLGLLPFLTAVLTEGYGHHLMDTAFQSHWFSISHQWVTHLSYLTCLFWGSLQAGTSYGPSWGGMLNPILSSLFFLGLLKLLRTWRSEWSGWIIFAFLICLSPAFLISDYVELNRIIQVLPVLLFIAVIGIQELLMETTPRLRWAVLGVLLSISCGLDWFHFLKPSLEKPYWKFQFLQSIPDENANAYRILNQAASLEGPGLVFTDFLLLSHNHSLNPTTYHFNAALNPDLDPSRAKWVGLMVNRNYQIFLSKRFPGAKWFPASPSPQDDGGMVVGVIPVMDQNRALFQKWKKVHWYFHQLSVQAEGVVNNRQRYQEALRHLPEGYALVQGDPFLECCFGEWLAQYQYGPTYDINIAVLKRAIQKGYPSANLYFKLGNFYRLNRQNDRARRAYEKALKCVSNYTAAAQDLR